MVDVQLTDGMKNITESILNNNFVMCHGFIVIITNIHGYDDRGDGSKMSSRKKIEKFCEENDVSINKLEYDRNYESVYGDCSNESEWIIECLVKGEAEILHAYTADELIDEIQDAIDNI